MITKPKSAAALAERPRRAIPKNAAADRALRGQVPPGATSTTTPGGIRHNDPDAVPPALDRANHRPAGMLHHDPSVAVGQLDPKAMAKPPVKRDSRLDFESDIPIEQIDASSANPRKMFAPEELAELEASIREHGLLQPLVVRSGANGRYELVAGERRLRAVRNLRASDLWTRSTVPARICQLTDSEAAEIRLVENLQRADLSAIEEAEAFEQLIKQHGHTQEQLAAKLGKSQPHVAGRLALLKLPKVWREKIITRVISPTHARHLLPYADKPGLLDRLDKAMFDKKGHYQAGYSGDEHVPNQEQFGDDVECELTSNEISRSMSRSDWHSELGQHVKPFKPTEEEAAELDLIEIDGDQHALNTKLWDKLQAAHIATLKSGGKSGKKGMNAKPVKRTPAQEKAAKKKQAEIFKRRLAEWRTNWLRYLVSQRAIEDPRLALATVTLRLAGYKQECESERLCELTSLEPRKNTWSRRKHKELTPTLANHAQPAELLVQLAADWLWCDDQPRETFGADEVEALAGSVSIDLAKAWKADLAGPLTEAYFNLHSKDQLEGLAREYGYKFAGSKSEIVKLFAGAEGLAKKLPAEITAVATTTKKKAKPR